MKNKTINLSDIKYVFFDMDGTLLTSNKTISLRSIESINKLQSLGVKCSIATGRPYYFAMKEIKSINAQLPIISCNGSLIWDPIKKEIISFNSIDKQQSKKIFDILVANNIVFLIYTTNEIIKYKNDITNPTSNWFKWIDENNSKTIIEDRANIVCINNIESFDINKYDVVKFLIICSEISNDNIKIIENELDKVNNVYLVRSQSNVIDIMPEGLSKGNGLKMLNNKNIIDLNKTLAFGDAENDISMFNVVKWSVAMENANKNIKEIATFITNDNNNEGISNFFEKNLNYEK